MKKIITICGSSKNLEYIDKLQRALEKAGFDILSFQDTEKSFIGLNEGAIIHIARSLTLNHFRKIEQGDIILFANLDGYMGISASMELGYASAQQGKIIVALNHDAEYTRQALFDTVLDEQAIDIVANKIQQLYG